MITDYENLHRHFPKRFNEMCKKFESKDPLVRVEAFLELTYRENQSDKERR